jgi:hypothetical protein
VDAPAARRTPRGFGPAALVATVLIGLFFGVIPIYQYVDAHRVPADATLRTAVVTGADRGARGTDRGNLVRFRLRDGSTGEVYFESRFDHPDRGETIEVYRSGNGWGSPQERSVYGLLGGIGALVLSGVLALGWLRVRRRGSLSPTSG